MKKYACPMHPQVLKTNQANARSVAWHWFPLAVRQFLMNTHQNMGIRAFSTYGHADENFNKHGGDIIQVISLTRFG